MFWTVSLSIISSLALYTQQNLYVLWDHPDLTCKQSAKPVCIAVCTVLDSWWWPRETVRNM